MENGKDINEILNMPYKFVLKLIEKKHAPKRETSLISTFTLAIGR
ncbi:phage tail assembly chaperone GT [Alkalicoccobacillus gibsonii]